MNQWTSTFMEKGIMLPKIVGDTAGMCMFAIMLGVGRAIFGVYGSKIDINKIMIRGSLVAAVGSWLMGKATDSVTVSLPNLTTGGMSAERLELRMGMLIASGFPILTMILHKVLKSVKDK